MNKSILTNFFFAALVSSLMLVAPDVHARSEKLTDAADVLFSENSSSVSSNGAEKLSHLVAKLQQKSLDVIIAIGHAAAHEIGGEALGLQRALAVKRVLMTLGIPPAIIYTEGKLIKNQKKDLVGTQENSTYSKPRVEVEAAGLWWLKNPATRGFSEMHLWFDKNAKGQVHVETLSDSLSDTHPLIFLRSIEDEKLRVSATFFL